MMCRTSPCGFSLDTCEVSSAGANCAFVTIIPLNGEKCSVEALWSGLNPV